MNGSDETVDELTLHARKRVGTRVRDKWRLDELLGVGGMAAVYAATHRNGRRVAIKILHDDPTMTEDSRARFLREGYVANAVGHPGAVNVIDDDVTEDGSPFITMELLRGETLDQRVRRKGTLGAVEVLATAHAILDVLVAAHGKGIVHRDIKPENLFLTRASGVTGGTGVKILDFGIAHFDALAPSTGMHDGHSMGTPAFMPPEQARGRWDDVDVRSDLWALGATLFTLLTGRHVHEAATMNEVLLGAMTCAAKPIARCRPELPRSVCAIVDRALAFDRADRWQTAVAMQTAVREAYGELEDPAGAPDRAPALTPPAVALSHAVALVPPAPLSSAQRLGFTRTGQPTTLTAGMERAPLPRPPRREWRRLGLATAAVVGGVALLSMFVVASSGSGTPSTAAEVSSSSLPKASAGATTPPAPPGAVEPVTPPATGTAIVTVQPSDPPTLEAATRPAPAAAPARAWHAHRAPAPAAAPGATPVPGAPAPSPPAAPSSDPLNRRH